MAKQHGWRERFRLGPNVSAWPFVVVILTQMAVGGFSVYTLSTIRAFVSGESLWSKSQHEAVYFLSLYLDSEDTRVLKAFHDAIAVPLAYREGRLDLERENPDPVAARRALLRAGIAPQDIPSLIWMYSNFRSLPYLKEALAKWSETDPYILELDRIGASVGTQFPTGRVAELRGRVEQVDAAITPKAIAFSRVLDDGARIVERILLVVNIALAGVLAMLTIWRVGKVLRQRRSFEDALSWQASHDELTSLANRRAFEENLLHALTPVKGERGAACALMFIDLDQFKIINDTCGHAAGDAMLRRIGPPLQDLLGPDDLIARLGGDEFGILVWRTDVASALALAEAVRVAVEHVEFSWHGRSFKVTASIGLAHDYAGTISPEQMMSEADMACFMAKEKGRNCVQIHRKEDQETRGRVSEMNWVHRIQHALAEDRFVLHAQEIVALADGGEPGVHLEVLIRMCDEQGALVPPSSFLPAAERFGLMKQVDRWVVRQAFRTLAERRKIAQAEPIVRCGINLSGVTVGDDAFLDFLKAAFAEFRVPPSIISFEITETTAIVNLDAARAFIHELKALGCTFSLDDFGSGMSSFNYLKELPVDVLKIDGAFVKNLLLERSDRAMVEMIVHVGHVMGKQIVAEFVETEEIASALRDIGVDFAQGYGIATPKPFTAQFEGVAKTMLYRPDVDRTELARRRLA
ncbi:Diguanylate cyclase (GGDEF) domain-containing protein [Beijerinckiaceae bacterium RH AL1]|nr:EAL domain-containing protein [Beijerinckiaceae bacterium]VVB44474.1 Diguanylate cyclase (GGDEF) domain-containing protein [Beijerinckiaceae bacterium RH CH11]VVB44554.1 Diguanylate cyclase (GGDEF) domain-containing protein [Beijerinckiaceae bacterium RH AL8]VVC54372.1 Diguanylate cyclase (GGDEF) domain-containing protein [Beijerinckiaceae bacterium RH AL1]